MSAVYRGNKGPGIAFKLSAIILISTTLIFLVAFIYNYTQTRKLVLKSVEKNTGHLALSTVHSIETILCSVDSAPRYLAASLEHMDCRRPDLLRHIEGIVRLNPEIYGSTVAFEPYAHDRASRDFSPYYSRQNGQVRLSWLGGDNYRYHFWDWYILPKELNRAVWSEPYFDEGGGNTVMSTFSVPFYTNVRGVRTFTGVVTADMSLEWLKDIIAEVEIYETGYAFLISQNGMFIAHPNKDLIMRETIFTVAEMAGDLSLRDIGRKMIQGERGFVALPEYFAEKKAWIYYVPLPSAGWSIGLVIPEKELFADVRHLSKIVLIIGFAGFVFLFFVVTTISRNITQPLRQLAQTTTEIARGSLDVALPKRRPSDEVGDLANSFENMQLALKEYISNLKEATAARERMESELKIARTIQMSFLPKRFPPFPEKREFDIFASIVPAREVGGDLYDFFLLDDETLFFSIGDVSGKGVPAALFMAASTLLIKGAINRDTGIAEALAKVNRELCEGNDAMMFLTFFCATLNIRTGEMRYSNAGHNPPLIVRREEKPAWLDLPEGFLLGVMEESVYGTATIHLQPGDLLFLYTDGVTEAMNTDGQAYSEERLKRFIENRADEKPEGLVRKTIESVQEFADIAPQSDDITILALRYQGAADP
ncbi:MAG: SpoIIE family protein phosphatase [Deltaproteobacteria bacterium]|nr:SpoIIE family protein phosphatase [Deltaproteobacteria bacterium]